MGKFKNLFSRNKKEDRVEAQEVPETEDVPGTLDEQETEQSAGRPVMPIDVSMIQKVGYGDAVNLLTDAYSVNYWHDVEIDEEDLPETEDDLLLACRYANGDKGFEYRVGKFDDSAAAWKEIHYVDPNADEIELDEEFLERRLQQIQDQLPNIPDFSLIKRMYINGFGEGSRQMKRRIQDYKWHDIANAHREVREMSEDVMVAMEENGEICFAVVNQDALTVENIDSRFVAWANIEPFDSIMDQV